MNLFDLINLICAIVIFIFAACRLGARHWGRWSVEFWACVILLPSAVAMMAAPIPSLQVLVFRVGVAAYFGARTWRIWRLQQRMGKIAKAAAEPAATEETIVSAPSATLDESVFRTDYTRKAKKRKRR